MLCCCASVLRMTIGDVAVPQAYCRRRNRIRWAEGSQGGQPRVEVTISFGGLLLQLVGDPAKLEVLELDTFVFLLMRKV